MRWRVVQAVMRAGSAGLVFAAIVVQALSLADADRFDPTRFFAFFTIQSNLFGAILFLVLAARWRSSPSPTGDLFRGAAVVYLTVTFIVVVLFLSGADLQVAIPWVDFVLHKVFPIVVVVDWLLDPPIRRLGLRHALAWLVFPVAWLAATMIRGAADGWYPYPFLDPAKGGYGSVVVYVIGISIGVLVISGVTIAVGGALARRRLSSSAG